METKGSKKKGRSNLPKIPRGNLWGNIATTLVVFLLLMSTYSLVTDFIKDTPEIPLSELAASVEKGEIKKIVVKGNSLNITRKDDTEKISKKESEAGLAETLSSYGVSPAELSKIEVSIENQSGFGYWFLTLTPILLPLAFIGFFIWFLSRQVKGAGMQAFTFGQSKARLIDPADKSQRITFKDVAGAKEAKE
ncbi:MAG: ATP-dependent metallopeptidase FtsH/Yme1/Tma family protein, partial [Patescibacteria group bacterium]